MDPWRLERSLGELSLECSPERLRTGWELSDCSGARGLLEGFQLTVFVPAQGESGLEVKLSRGAFTFPTLTLTRLPQLDEPEASPNVALVWHEAGESIHTDVWAAHGMVFAARLDGVIEILDAKSGRIQGTASVVGVEGGDPYIVLDVKAQDGMLYVATVSNGLVIFALFDPSAPELMGQYHVDEGDGSPENFTNIHNIFLSPDGNLVYAMNQSLIGGTRGTSVTTDLRIIDVSDATSPREVGRFSTDVDVGFVHDINVIEREGRLIAFLNLWEAGLWILDVTDPGSISVLSSFAWDGVISHSGWPFARDGKLYYAHAEEGYDRHLTILDVTGLTSPRIISSFSTRPGVSIHNVHVVDGVAYIAYYIDGLRVVDLRDPENPIEIGHFDTVPAEDKSGILQGAWGVRVLDGTVYISDLETGTYAFQVDVD